MEREPRIKKIMFRADAAFEQLVCGLGFLPGTYAEAVLAVMERGAEIWLIGLV